MKNKLTVAATSLFTALVLTLGYNLFPLPHLPSKALAQESEAVPEELFFDREEVTDEGIELRWRSNSDSTETEYVLYRRVLPHEKLSEYATVPRSGNSTSFTDANVEPGLKYLYRFAGVNSAGEGPKSDPVKLIVPGERLEAPADLAAVYTEQGMEVTWGAPTNAGITDYQVYRGKFLGDGGAFDGQVSKYVLIPAESDPMTFVDTDVEQGAAYRYRVAAVNATGEGFRTTWLDVVATISEADVTTSATGAPTIAGIARVGETLTADVTGIADEDGLTDVVFSYQWVRIDGGSDTNIQDATGSSYTLVKDDGGKTIKVEVSFTDNAGNEETLTSAATGSVVWDAPPEEVLFYREEVTDEGIELTWTSNSDSTETEYVLYRRVLPHEKLSEYATVPRSGNSTSFTDTNVEPGLKYLYRLAGVNSAGEGPKSDPVRLVVPGERLEAPADLSAVYTERGMEVTWSAPTNAGITDYQVYRGKFLGDGGAFDGQVSKYALIPADSDPMTYVDTDVEQGATYRYRVAAVNATGEGFRTTWLDIQATISGADADTSATGAPTIAGIARVGETLAADVTGIADEDGLTDVVFSYQWVRIDGGEDTNIQDATGVAYTLASDDGGKTIKVEVSFTDNAGNEETLASDPTEAVVQPNRRATGVPTISGEPGIYANLTADTSDIEDEDGMSRATFAYQWLIGTDDDGWVAGDTDSLYLVHAIDVGHTIRVRVTFTDDRSNEETLTSDPTEPAFRPNNSAIGLPTISGTLLVGEELRADTSGIEDEDGLGATTFSYQWLRNDVKIAGATESSYWLTAEDEGGTIRVRVSFTDYGGSVETLASEPSEPVVQQPNRMPSGEPTIIGTAKVGEELTADTSAIEDENGLSRVKFSYQWLRNEAEIAGATEASYRLAADDENRTIRVRVSFTDDRGYEETRTSDPTAVVVQPNRRATGAPTIVGTLLVGETLEADTSGIEDEDGLSGARFHYKWFRGRYIPQLKDYLFVYIEGTTESTYTLTAEDVAWVIRVQVRFKDDSSHAEILKSDPTAVVVQPNRRATGAPTIGGTLLVGEELTADTSGIEDEDGLSRANFSYQWLRNEAEIAGATESNYTLTDEDEGRTIQVRVSFTDDRGNEQTLASDPAAVVVQPNRRATGAPTIVGTLLVGEELTADTSGIEDEDGLSATTFSYQWLRNEAEIAGATEASYRLTADDENRTIRVRVSFTDDRGYEETLTSDPTAVVVQPNRRATGAPTIVGTLLVGETLEADTSGIEDEDGLSATTYSYQWLRNEAEIAGATESNYTLTDEDEGRTIQVRVSFTDDRGNEETLASDPTAVVVQPNRRATGAPTIVGTLLVGETLEADTSGIEDEDGLSASTFSYQWLRSEAEIAGATESNYTLTDEDEDRTIQVRVSFTDDRGNEETRTSDPTAVVVQPNRRATGAPTIVGTLLVGETLEADTSGIEDEDGLSATTFSYQWLRNEAEIAGATEASYRLTADDENRTIRVRVSFTDDRGYEETLTSDPTAVVVQPNRRATGVPTISGALLVGEELTADTSGIEDEDGLSRATFSYQWLRSEAEIAGATESNYTLTDEDEGRTIQVRVSFTDHRGYEETRTSDPTAVVVQPNRRATGAPTISGALLVGEELTADTSGIEDEDGLSRANFSYQWLRNDAEIAGATEPGYTLTEDDEGKTVKVRVSFTDDRGYEETRTSDPTAVVVQPNRRATGAPTISGALLVGEELTADTSGIEDEDGLSRANFSYQWLRNEAEIAGATEPGYTLTEDDEGKTVKVRVSFTDHRGYEETLTSDPTAVVVQPNRRATGVPTISGALLVGETLEADTSGIEDEDGLSASTFSYQWLRSDAEIAGATESNYTLTDEDEGRTIQVRVSFTDDRGNEQTLASDPTAVVVQPNRRATGAPTISGALLVGEELTADTSGIEDEDGLSGATFSYQWLRSEAEIAGATEPDYTLTEDDEGKTVKVRVSFTDHRGYEETRTSDPTAVVVQPNRRATGAPTISGALLVGETLEADTSGIEDEDGLSATTYSYQWLRNEAEIAGATESNYTLTDEDEGRTIQVRVSFTDDRGNEETLASDPTAVVVQPNRRATGAPTIVGTLLVGEELTADTSGIEDEDGLSRANFSYQWLRNDAEIAGATESGHTLTEDDEGRTIQVRVSFTDHRGYEETLTSDPTAAVSTAATPSTDPIWRATFTVGQSGDIYGYSLPLKMGDISRREFTLDETNYSVHGLAERGGILYLVLDRPLPISFALYMGIFGELMFASVDATLLTTDLAYVYHWPVETSNWTVGEIVPVSLREVDDAPGSNNEPLTAQIEDAPEIHDGGRSFTFKLRFSEEVVTSYKTLRDRSFEVTGGTVVKAQRMFKPSNILWTITVTPDSNADVSITLSADRACGLEGAICTSYDKRLTSRLELNVSGPGE